LERRLGRGRCKLWSGRRSPLPPREGPAALRLRNASCRRRQLPQPKGIWNQHVEDEVNMEPKAPELMQQRQFVIQEDVPPPMERRPRRAEGQARLSCPPPGTGPERPAQLLLRAEEEGAWCPHPAGAPAGRALGSPGPRAPRVRPGVERGHPWPRSQRWGSRTSRRCRCARKRRRPHCRIYPCF